MKVFVKLSLLAVSTLVLITSLVDSLPRKSAPAVQNMEDISENRGQGDRDVTKDSPQSDEYRPAVHPCFNTTVNHTVTTPEGKEVLCLVPTEQELMKDIEAIGGYNRHYVAVTMEQAWKDFENPFDPIANKSKPITWESKFTGRRRRSIDEKGYDTAIEEGRGRVKRAVKVGLQSCERKGNKTSLGFIQLCDECWWITKLSDNKFPRYINEKICGDDGSRSSPTSFQYCEGRNDGFCLQQSFSQDLLVRTNRYVQIPSPDPQYSVVYKQVWVSYSQEIRSCCQCQNMPF